MTNDILDAYLETIPDAEPSEIVYVSLYSNIPFYGGPEEGGWYGEDTVLIAYYACEKRIAKKLKKQINKLAKEKSKRELEKYGDHCLRTCEWLNQRGLDPDYLPEPDGPVTYFVVVEKQPGSRTHYDSRTYQ